MVDMKKASRQTLKDLWEIAKGDKPGHPFRGNQHTGGGSSGSTGSHEERLVEEHSKYADDNGFDIDFGKPEHDADKIHIKSRGEDEDGNGVKVHSEIDKKTGEVKHTWW